MSDPRYCAESAHSEIRIQELESKLAEALKVAERNAAGWKAAREIAADRGAALAKLTAHVEKLREQRDRLMLALERRTDRTCAALDEVNRLRQAIQRVREDTGYCPVCDSHHAWPTESCP